MANNETELEVLDQIVDVLGGTSGQYETVVPTLQQILALLGGGGGGSGSGYNPSLSVGRADALTGADSTAQWSQRMTEGSGSATVRSVQGATVAWNQLYTNDAASKTQNGITFTNNGDGSWTIEGMPAALTRYQITTLTSGIPIGHKVLLSMHASRASDYVTLFMSHLGSDSLECSAATNAAIKEARAVNGTDQLSIRVATSFDGQPITITPQCFDLTAMFGSGNEPATVAEFERMYPASYYPYSAPTLKPVQISGIRSTDAQGGEMDSVEWETQTLRAAGSVHDELTAGELVMRVGVADLGTLTWRYISDNVFSATLNDLVRNASNRLACAAYTPMDATYPNDSYAVAGLNDKSVATSNHLPSNGKIFLKNTGYTDPNALKASLSGIYCFYQLATPTTTPISPALPTTYHVEQGGSESIIVPEGEVSAAPILTVAEGESAADLVMNALACIAAPDGPVATANHALNTYLTMGGKLYKVTSAIAVGETIAAGTNVTETTVMAELLALTA